MELLNVRNFAFSELGFSKLIEFESKKEPDGHPEHLRGADGQTQYFFYYPDEIIIYMAREDRLEKHIRNSSSNGRRPFYPVLHYQGKLLLFLFNQELILTVGRQFFVQRPGPDLPRQPVAGNRENRFCPLQITRFQRESATWSVPATMKARTFSRTRSISCLSATLPSVSGIIEKKTFPAMPLIFRPRKGSCRAST